jgi:uncharacterized protein YqeY
VANLASTPFLTLGKAKMAKRSAKAIVALTVRLREELRANLELAAKRNKKSLNSEIANRLESSLRRENISEILETILRTHEETTRNYLHVIREDINKNSKGLEDLLKEYAPLFLQKGVPPSDT